MTQLILNSEALTKAAQRARESRLHVQSTSVFRQYRVSNRANGQSYVVNYFKRNGAKYVDCTCKAGAAAMVCKHVAASLPYHVWIASQVSAR